MPNKNGDAPNGVWPPSPSIPPPLPSPRRRPRFWVGAVFSVLVLLGVMLSVLWGVFVALAIDFAAVIYFKPKNTGLPSWRAYVIPIFLGTILGAVIGHIYFVSLASDTHVEFDQELWQWNDFDAPYLVQGAGVAGAFGFLCIHQWPRIRKWLMLFSRSR